MTRCRSLKSWCPTQLTLTSRFLTKPSSSNRSTKWSNSRTSSSTSSTSVVAAVVPFDLRSDPVATRTARRLVAPNFSTTLRRKPKTKRTFAVWPSLCSKCRSVCRPRRFPPMPRSRRSRWPSRRSWSTGRRPRREVVPHHRDSSDSTNDLKSFSVFWHGFLDGESIICIIVSFHNREPHILFTSHSINCALSIWAWKWIIFSWAKCWFIIEEQKHRESEWRKCTYTINK